MAMETQLSRLLHGLLFCCLTATLSPRCMRRIVRNHRTTGKPRPRAQNRNPGIAPHRQQGPARAPPRVPNSPPRGRSHDRAATQAARPQPARPAPGETRPTPAQTRPARPQPGTRPPANRPPQHRPVQGRPPHSRPPQWGRPPQSRPSYSFRPSDRDRLRGYYAARIRAINRARRPRFVIGGYYPYADIGYLQPVPPDVYGYLPPPPPGYQMGYYDGYVVVYDPITYFITNLIDLMQ